MYLYVFSFGGGRKELPSVDQSHSLTRTHPHGDVLKVKLGKGLIEAILGELGS
jgi:hypothetical protein